MDKTVIVAIVLSAIFIVGGLIAVYYGNKASQKLEEEELKKQKNR